MFHKYTYVSCLFVSLCFLFQKTNKLDRETGVLSVMYDLIKSHSLVLNGAPVTMLEVKLKCDFGRTPWCLKKEDHYLLKDVAVPPEPDMRNP